MSRACLVALLLVLMTLVEPIAAESPRNDRVLVIAHRGASAWLPEHTLAAYARGVADGADMIEPDLVPTRDGVLVARHESGIDGTTDVADHPEFADRRTRRQIEGREVEGWFTEDFTLAELKTLRAREPLPQLRGTQHDGRFEIATLAEIIELVAAEAAKAGRLVGIAPEIKHSTYFRERGLPLEDVLLATLAAHPYTRRAPVWVQSFEIANLRYLRTKLGNRHTNIRLLQLIGRPEDKPAGQALGKRLRYADMLSPKALRDIAEYAHAIGVPSRSYMAVDAAGELAMPTSLVRDAHAAGLDVIAYTFRPENQFLPRSLWLGDDPRVRNGSGSIAEIRAHLDAGIDGFFTDDPALGREAVRDR